jgi:kelch-like protein 10
MNQGRSTHCVAVLGDAVYVMGGHDDYYSALKTSERYDSKTNKWSSIADVNVARTHASATALNGKIDIVGGYDTGFLRSAEVYDPRTNRWTLISDMRIGRSLLSCIAFHGCVYAIGGVTNGRIYTSSGVKYDPETDTWSPIPDMSVKRCEMATAAIDDKIFVIGGRDYNEFTNRVECFNDVENEWFEATGMSAAMFEHQAVVVSDLPNVNDYIGRRKRQE